MTRVKAERKTCDNKGEPDISRCQGADETTSTNDDLHYENNSYS
eukprot:CAMPEP_0168352248 /NCGR_PEP_ID=MMETSP0213-20121227/22424_1 /TAXON_ID=151035 /ORGANISM="Euplotes harpa, Strain FSP1.4" /LENGTH=43 /DNA_ID= /DNA_START= /DNA_END= /DNA_ORIENTATION=